MSAQRLPEWHVAPILAVPDLLSPDLRGRLSRSGRPYTVHIPKRNASRPDKFDRHPDSACAQRSRRRRSSIWLASKPACSARATCPSSSGHPSSALLCCLFESRADSMSRLAYKTLLTYAVRCVLSPLSARPVEAGPDVSESPHAPIARLGSESSVFLNGAPSLGYQEGCSTAMYDSALLPLCSVRLISRSSPFGV